MSCSKCPNLRRVRKTSVKGSRATIGCTMNVKIATLIAVPLRGESVDRAVIRTYGSEKDPAPQTPPWCPLRGQS